MNTLPTEPPTEDMVWSVEDADRLYNVSGWGGGYFGINASGRVEARPTQEEGVAIDLMQVVEEAVSRRLGFPLLIRVQDLLRHRVETINKAFARAVEELGYHGVYRGVFPIKVNQLREVVEEILDAGAPYHFGIEAGSKPELIAALSVHSDPDSLIICNGYKDATFIQQALIGRRLQKKVILVVEKLEELEQILRISKSMSIEPMIGIRVRLQSKGAGKWALSGGENAKFGLNTTDIVQACEMLRDENLQHALQLVHFHVGSQVPDIVTISRAVREATRYFCKLHKMGFAPKLIDVGGGLGVDYDGSRTNFESSTNYSLGEYARDIVHNIMEVCDSEEVEHPIIVSESGRAIAAHHSVLVVEAFGAVAKGGEKPLPTPKDSDQKIVHDILEIANDNSDERRMENLHDAQQIKERSEQMFELGLLGIEEKARIDEAFWNVSRRTVQLFADAEFVPEEVRELETQLADQYVCNFSVFQSLLDHWALGQLFPIMPLHQLDKEPDRRATLVDITCDSDGKVSKFIDLKDVKESLPLHRLQPGEPYYLGVFLSGAYQDIMGDLHNLFGRVTEVHVFLDEDEDDGFYIEEVIPGSTIAQVLSFTQWDRQELVRKMKKQVDEAIKADRIKPNEGMRLLATYEKGLEGYTYLQLHDEP
ncbi:MAG: biosynthetic arginine decarboxylase [Verrucomicrobiales bacterium]